MSEHVLYRHFAKRNQLLYAGRTNEPPRRMRDHRSKNWWDKVVKTTYQSFDTLDLLKAAERKAIETEHPVWNIQYNTQRKAKAGPARKPWPTGQLVSAVQPCPYCEWPREVIGCVEHLHMTKQCCGPKYFDLSCPACEGEVLLTRSSNYDGCAGCGEIFDWSEVSPGQDILAYEFRVNPRHSQEFHDHRRGYPHTYGEFGTHKVVN